MLPDVIEDMKVDGKIGKIWTLICLRKGIFVRVMRFLST